jgi:multisubunit Na+/H+ antiporter MnhB subunit
VIPVPRTPPAPASALPARRPETLVPPARGAGQHGGAGYAARHTPAAAPVISPPKVHSGPRRRPVGALMLVIAGLAIAVIGGWLLLRTGQGVTACSHQVAAICSEGFAVLTGTQVLGGALVLAGLVLFFTALYRALR